MVIFRKNLPIKRSILFEESRIFSLAAGNCLREWRKAKGLTQEKLAERMGFSRRMVRNYETGKYKMEWQFFLRFSLIAGFSLSELFSYMPENLPPGNSESSSGK